MTGVSFASRYWRSLTTGAVRRGPGAAPRVRAGYGFWQRYWASLTGATLPALPGLAAAATTKDSAPSSGPKAQAEWLVSAPGNGWLRLPPVPQPASLLAAGGGQVVSEATSADGRFALFVRAPSGLFDAYRLEVVLSDVDAAPAMVFVRYGGNEASRLLLIPLVRPQFGPPSAQILLPGFHAGIPWEISSLRPLERTPEWTTESVAASVNVAWNRTARDAWRVVRELFNDDQLGSVIDQGLL